jgi:hypothetical protein
MKYKVLILILLGCSLFISTPNAQQNSRADVLDFYREFSPYTDPGEYAYLYEELPDSLQDLCHFIKRQFIHPVDLKPFLDIIPKERYYEDPKYPTVKTLLAGLLKHNPDGLTRDRQAEHRLIVTCRYHSILLASILKNRGVPTRVRYGFAPYLSKDKGLHICHVICEVWNASEERWMFVDPDREMVDFPADQFELAGDVWLQLQHGEINPQKYDVAKTWGEYAILDMLCHDFASVQGKEFLYWEQPPISEDEKMDIDKIEQDKIKILNEISVLLKNPDRHVHELKSIYHQYEYLQYER